MAGAPEQKAVTTGKARLYEEAERKLVPGIGGREDGMKKRQSLKLWSKSI